MSLSTLHDLMIDELKDIYDAEHQMTKALPKMAKAASSTELKNGFEQHLSQTEKHIEHLEQVFEILGEKKGRKTCVAMEGLVKEGEELIKENKKGDVLDAALIVAAQKVEHYEMAAYGSVRTYAQLMGYKDAAKLLQITLDEEGAADEKLTRMAQSLNVEAMA